MHCLSFWYMSSLAVSKLFIFELHYSILKLQNYANYLAAKEIYTVLVEVILDIVNRMY